MWEQNYFCYMHTAMHTAVQLTCNMCTYKCIYKYIYIYDIYAHNTRIYFVLSFLCVAFIHSIVYHSEFCAYSHFCSSHY